MIKSKQYPIGIFVAPVEYIEENVQRWINEIEFLPKRLQEILEDMPEQDLDISYRESGWTVKQVVHHLADSHMNAFIRCKLAMTEDIPSIKPYVEGRWAELSDTEENVICSIQILSGLHKRWIKLFRSMNKEDFNREFYHPEMKTTISLYVLLGLYAWHGNHHLGHIKLVKER